MSNRASRYRMPGDGALRDRRIPSDWRDHLLDPAIYYAAAVSKLSRPNPAGWAQGVCPFHDDSHASLSVQLVDARGAWRCFAGCGGGDMLGFHMKRTGKLFKDAVLELLRGGA